MIDVIDRKYALKNYQDVCQNISCHECPFHTKSKSFGTGLDEFSDCELERFLLNLPSVQIEALTDKEQRIFLSAMSREYKICKKADKEYYGIDNINLVGVCREIERKVKKALWA